MNTKRTVILSGLVPRRTAAQYLADAPDGWVMTLAPKTRSVEQNSRLWAMLGDIARQVDWYGKKLSPEDWKHVFSASIRKLQVVPNLDGSGFVALGLSTSRMSVAEMRDLIDLAMHFGDERGVHWSESEAVA